MRSAPARWYFADRYRRLAVTVPVAGVASRRSTGRTPGRYVCSWANAARATASDPADSWLIDTGP